MRKKLTVLNDGSICFKYTSVRRKRRGFPDEETEHEWEFKNIDLPEFVLFLLDNLLDEELCDVIDACSKRLRLRAQDKLGHRLAIPKATD